VSTSTLPQGGQTLYNAELADLICYRMSQGESLNAICLPEDFPVAESTVRLWAIQDREGFSAKYRLAREMQIDHWAEEIKELGDKPLVGLVTTTTETAKSTETKIVESDNVERSKLQVHTREWLSARMAPRKWGDRLDISGEIDCKLSVQFSIAPAPAARVELPASVRALLPAPGVARSAELPGEQSAK